MDLYSFLNSKTLLWWKKDFPTWTFKPPLSGLWKFTHKHKDKTKLCSTNDAKLLTVGNAFLVAVLKYGPWGWIILRPLKGPFDCRYSCAQSTLNVKGLSRGILGGVKHREPAHTYNLFILFHFLLFFFKILYFSTVCNLKSNLLSPWHSQAKLGCLYNLIWYQVRVARCIPFSSAEPVVSWSRGRETRGEPLVAYKLSRVALGTRMGASVSVLRATARGLEANV